MLVRSKLIALFCDFEMSPLTLGQIQLELEDRQHYSVDWETLENTLRSFPDEIGETKEGRWCYQDYEQ